MINKTKIDKELIEKKFYQFVKSIEEKYEEMLSNDDIFLSDGSSKWEKYGKKRIYYKVSIVRYYRYKSPSYKTKKGFRCGYYDEIDNCYVVNDNEVNLLEYDCKND